MGRKRIGIVCVVATALFVVGCGGKKDWEAEKQARLAVIAEEGAQLQNALSDVEARMHVNRARVAIYEELGQRHRAVSAIACEVADSHMLAIVKHVEKNERKSQKARWNRRVANAVPAGGKTGGGK